MATRKTTSSKKPTAPKSATSPAAVPEAPVADDSAAAAGATLKKKEFFNRVRARATGVKGHDVRVVLDAVLEELALTLVEGKGLSAPSLGTLKVQKHRELTGADVVVCKLRRKKRTGGGTDPLAEAAE